jgi:hypothetical protein
MPTFIAKGTGKAVGEESARETLAKIMFYIGEHGIAQGVLPARLREIGLYVRLHGLIAHGSLRASAPPINARGLDRLRFAEDTSIGSGHPCRPLSSRFGLCLKGNEPSGDRQCSELSETSAWDRSLIGSLMNRLQLARIIPLLSRDLRRKRRLRSILAGWRSWVMPTPARDPIAWYGGDSGVRFELEEGHNIDYLSDRQFNQNPSGGAEATQSLGSV